MYCEICKRKVHTERRSYFNIKNIDVCGGCDAQTREHRAKPYSKVMDNVALAECGYFYNRKRAKLY